MEKMSVTAQNFKSLHKGRMP